MGLITDLNLPDDFPGTCWVSGAFLFPNSGTLITILKTSPSVRSDSEPPYARLTFIILRRPEPNSSVRPISPINRAITGSFGNGGKFSGSRRPKPWERLLFSMRTWPYSMISLAGKAFCSTKPPLSVAVWTFPLRLRRAT
jgi:hypothetical protein